MSVHPYVRLYIGTWIFGVQLLPNYTMNSLKLSPLISQHVELMVRKQIFQHIVSYKPLLYCCDKSKVVGSLMYAGNVYFLQKQT